MSYLMTPMREQVDRTFRDARREASYASQPWPAALVKSSWTIMSLKSRSPPP